MVAIECQTRTFDGNLICNITGIERHHIIGCQHKYKKHNHTTLPRIQ